MEKVNTGWRTIETVPRDETAVLVWHARWRCPVAAKWSDAIGLWTEATLTTRWPDNAFSHWMPLPAPPE
jgi:hypothetical protein